MDSVDGSEGPPDFFISRAGADAECAAEIGRILEEVGHTVVLQQWDFANRNFMERMHWALQSGARVIALLSNDYLASDHCAAEWQNAIAHDPLNKDGRLIVLRVGESTLSGLLTALAYWDLVPVRGDGALLHDIVLTAVAPGRHKDDRVRPAQYWRAPRPIVHPAIRPTPSFTGRESELASIHELLWAGRTAAVTQPVAAHGLGGVGKSALAREYGRRNQNDYAGVWWLNAARPEDGTPGFEGIERALVELGAIFIRGLDQVQDRRKAARQTLELIAQAGFDKPWLLVYDNVDDPRVLREWVPIGNAHVLVTSQLSGWSREVGTIEIEQWELAEAVRYLLQESGRFDLAEGDAAEIAIALGRLPLALSHAAALLRARPNITAASYLASLGRRMSEAPPDAEYPRAVFATFKEAFAAAEAEARGASAVMSLAAFFAPDDIPEELFKQPPECYPPTLAKLRAAPGGMDDAIGALANLSLVDFHLRKRAFSVHRVVQAAARDALGDEAAAWSRSALMVLVSAFPVPEPEPWSVCERLVTHVRAMASHVTNDSEMLACLLGRTGDYLRWRSTLAEVLPLYERSRAILECLVHADPGNVVWQQDLGASHYRIGEVQLTQGNLASALDSYRAQHEIARRLAQSDPDNGGLRRVLGISNEGIGDVLMAQGDFPEALRSYKRMYRAIQGLTERDPDNAGWQRDLSVALNRIGNVYRAQGRLGLALDNYRAGYAIAERIAQANPGNAGWQHDLAISNERIGDVLTARGNLSEALPSYRSHYQIIDALAKRDPDNARWQRDLSLAHTKIGDILVRQRDLRGALDRYQASLAIDERLARSDPGNPSSQRDLSVIHERIGKVLMMQGNLPGAFRSYVASLGIAQRLAAQVPSNAEWQGDLSRSHIRVGDVLVAQNDFAGALAHFRAADAIAKRLVSADPDNAALQFDLGISNERIGDVLMAQGNLTEALDFYERKYRIISALALRDRGNVDWQFDLSVAHTKIGDVLARQRDLPGAFEAYEAGLAIRERLTTVDQHNAGWRRDLIVSKVRLAAIAAHTGESATARGHYQAALEIATDLHENGRLAPCDAWMVGDLEKRLAALPE